jgi:fused signal recognition particle receptor
MWSAIKARLTGRTEDRSTTAPAVPATGVAKPAEGVPFTDSWLGKGLKETTIDEVLDELEMVLLQSDVALPVIDRIRADLKRDLAGRKLRWGADTEDAIRRSLAHSVRTVLDRPKPDLLGLIRARRPDPFVILFVGVNGSGKTTTIAKLAGWLRGQEMGVVIAAGDTFRAGAIEQLLVHGERLGVKVVRQQEGSDPAAVAFDAIQHAKARKLDVVLIDTAGRQHTNENLLSEAKKIRRVAKPDLTVFVGDALSGNDAVEQAKLFTEALGVDALILTKLDADVKGGAALSAVQATGKPLLFVGIGQGYQDLKPFDVDWMVARLFAEGAAN